MSDAWETLAPEVLLERLAGWLASGPDLVRVALDGPPSTDPAALGERLVEPLRALGRPVAHVRAESFWRDASLRLEHGREDVESYRCWLDVAALNREVLEPAARTGRFLPSLRDPATNRSTREPVRALQPRAVLIVSGAFLLDTGLPFERTVHLATAPDARRRRTPPEDAWTLPAFDEYDATVHPADIADVVIKVDRRFPAVRRRS